MSKLIASFFLSLLFLVTRGTDHQPAHNFSQVMCCTCTQQTAVSPIQFYLQSVADHQFGTISKPWNAVPDELQATEIEEEEYSTHKDLVPVVNDWFNAYCPRAPGIDMAAHASRLPVAQTYYTPAEKLGRLCIMRI